MNWLFCCGDDSLKAKEGKSTLDLSKPIMPEVQFKDTEDLDGLSGYPSAQSKLLNDILQAKSKDKASTAFQQSMGSNETDGELTPFTRAVESLNSMQEHGSTNQQFNNSVRLVQDKRLNNYLMQAQKIIGRKGTCEDIGECLDEINQDYYEEPSSAKLISDKKPLQSQKSKQDSIKISTKQQHTNSQQKSYPLKKTTQNINILTDEDNLYDKALEKIEERKSDMKKLGSGMNHFTTVHSPLTPDEQDSINQLKNAPLSAKSQTSKGFFTSATKQKESSNAKSKLAAVVQSNNHKAPADIVKSNKTYGTAGQNHISRNSGGKMQNAVTTQNQKSKLSKKPSKKQLELELQGGSKFNKTISYKDQNFNALMNLQKSLNSSVESQNEQQIFPSQSSAFSFQPKYFKPQTTKNGNQTVINHEQSSMNSSSNNGIRFYDSVVTQKVLKDSQIDRMNRNSDLSQGGHLAVNGAQSLQSTPGYSASSTLLPNSRNPSIIPRDLIHQSPLVNQHNKEKLHAESQHQ